MKRVWIAGILAVLMSMPVFGQETGGENEGQGQEQQPLSAAQILVLHAAKKYQLAMRYNDINAAKQALYSVLAENPANDSILYTLSYMYLEQGQFASAAISARDLNALNPDYVGALEILGISYENLGVPDKALEAYEDLYFKTSDYQTLYKVAFLQYRTGKYGESMTNADFLLEKKEADELKAVFTGANNEQKEYPIRVALLNLKGLNAKAQGNNEDARTYFEQALEIAPDFAMAKENLNSLN
ncbi:MAG: tetratricopeptide repeat protein [Cyclobacteriaceae bacterium]